MLFRRENTRYCTWAEVISCLITGWGTTAEQVGDSELEMAVLEEAIILGW